MRYLIACLLALLCIPALAGEFNVTPAGGFSITPAVVVQSSPGESTCFVWRHQGGVGQAGTGTVIASEDGKSLVITNAHVVEGTNAPTVVVHAGKEWRASILAVARSYQGNGPDLSLVLVEGELPAAPIAESEPAQGERVRMWGFGGRMGSQGAIEKIGKFLGHPFNDQSNATLRTISGDSGSGWFNDSGELVAVHWGNNGQAWAVPLQSVRSFVKERAGRLFPRLAQRLSRAAPAPKAKAFDVVPATPPVAASPCPGDVCPVPSSPSRGRHLGWRLGF